MKLWKMRGVALGDRVVFMANNMCCQMIRNGHDSDWSDFGAGVGEGRGGGQILCINVPGLFTSDIMLPTLCLKMSVFSKKGLAEKDPH